MTVEQAVNDIIHRGIGELRKIAFGDDSEDAKNLPWKREQVWFLMKQLAKKGEVRTHSFNRPHGTHHSTAACLL